MKKSLIKLGIVALLIVVAAFLALNGLHFGNNPKYLKPVGEAIDTKTVPASGFANFAPITYAGETTLGEHKYVIVELPPESEDYNYDEDE